MLPGGGELRAWICVPEGCIQGTMSQLLTSLLWASHISLIERSKCCWGLHLFPFSRLVKGYSEGSPKGSRFSSLKAKEKLGKWEMVNLEFAKSKRMIQDSDLSSREWKGYLSSSLGWMVPKLLFSFPWPSCPCVIPPRSGAPLSCWADRFLQWCWNGRRHWQMRYLVGGIGPVVWRVRRLTWQNQ